MNTLYRQLLERARSENENWPRNCLSLPSGAEPRRTDEEPARMEEDPGDKRGEQRYHKEEVRQEEEREPMASDLDLLQRHDGSRRDRAQ